MRAKGHLQEVAALAVAALLALTACARDGGAPPPRPTDLDAWRADLDAWIEERYASLRKPDGWLSLAGLFWLEEGESSFGSDAANEVVFPPEAPPRIGTFVVGAADPAAGGARTVSVRIDPGASVTHAGAMVSAMELSTDVAGEPTLLELGPFLFHAIDRGGRIGIRLKNRESPLMAEFTAIDRFAPDPKWRVEARFERYDPPKTILIPNVVGPDLPETCFGRLVFELGGETRTAEPTGREGGNLFLVFGDTTNGKETYGGGRFLYADWPGEDGVTTLDFNRAYNPPCVFTPWATCPLPPPQNKLAMAITAGEKTYGHGGH